MPRVYSKELFILINEWKGVSTFWRKTLAAKINCYFSDSKKKKTESSNDHKIVSKIHWITHELQETDMSSTNKGAST